MLEYDTPIRARYAAGARNTSALSREYGLSRTAIRYLVQGRNWAHLPLTP